MNNDTKTEEGWRPRPEPKRIHVRKAPRKRTVQFWVAEIVTEGTVGPFPDAASAVAWAGEWSTIKPVLVMPVLCPVGVTSLLGVVAVKLGIVFPSDEVDSAVEGDGGESE